MASAASGPIFTNHCVDTSGSTTVPQRWQCPTACLCSAIFSSRPSLLQLLHERLAGLETVQARRTGPRPSVILPVFVDDGHARQRVALAHREVVRVVRRRHLHRARAERRVHERVGDDRAVRARSAAASPACRSCGGSARRRGAPPPPCRPASSRAAWSPPSRPAPPPDAPGTSRSRACRPVPCAATSRSDSAVRQRGHQLTM